MRAATHQLDRHKERNAVAGLLLVCAMLIGVGLTFGVSHRPTATLVELGNVADAHLVEIRDKDGTTVLSGEFRSQTDMVGNTEKDAALMDRQGRRVIGEVELEIPAAGRLNRRPELEVDIIELMPSATYTVYINDRPVGRFTTDDRGSIDLELQEGEAAPLPSTR